MRRFFAVSLLVTSLASAADRPRASADVAAPIRDWIEAQRQELHVAGLAYVVVADDRILAQGALGLRDVGRQLPVTMDTVFPIGSCTKSFTAMAVGIARDDGRLSLDDSPRRFLPEFRMQDSEANELTTLRDMLSHRTGLKAYADLAALGGVLRRDEYLRAAVGAKPVARLRETFQYSNAMVTAAGEAVARAYGSTWERVIEKTIFEPLGMHSSLASAYGAAMANDGTIGYEFDPSNQAWIPSPITDTLAVMAPAGAIAASANDLARWLRMLTGEGRLDGRQIVATETLCELTRPHTPINDSLSYALGWVTYEWNGIDVIEHNGGSSGLSALVSFIPSQRVGIALVANSSPTKLTQIGHLARHVWPIVFGRSDDADAPKVPPRGSAAPPLPPGTLTKLPSIDELLDRMLLAAGGRATLERHSTMRAKARISYENQGVQSEITTLAKAPSRRVEDETIMVGRKVIGRARNWFDGDRGAQQTTFGQDSTVSDDEIERTRRDDALHPLLELQAHVRDLVVERVAQLDGENVFVVLFTPSSGPALRLFVSARTALVVRRDVGNQVSTYSNFRNVDGEIVPFRVSTEAELGVQITTIEDIEFGLAIPDATFAPLARLSL